MRWPHIGETKPGVGGYAERAMAQSVMDNASAEVVALAVERNQ